MMQHFSITPPLLNHTHYHRMAMKMRRDEEEAQRRLERDMQREERQAMLKQKQRAKQHQNRLLLERIQMDEYRVAARKEEQRVIRERLKHNSMVNADMLKGAQAAVSNLTPEQLQLIQHQLESGEELGDMLAVLKLPNVHGSAAPSRVSTRARSRTSGRRRSSGASSRQGKPPASQNRDAIRKSKTPYNNYGGGGGGDENAAANNNRSPRVTVTGNANISSTSPLPALADGASGAGRHGTAHVHAGQHETAAYKYQLGDAGAGGGDGGEMNASSTVKVVYNAGTDAYAGPERDRRAGRTK
jgi:hypothetical protein